MLNLKLENMQMRWQKLLKIRSQLVGKHLQIIN